LLVFLGSKCSWRIFRRNSHRRHSYCKCWRHVAALD